MMSYCTLVWIVVASDSCSLQSVVVVVFVVVVAVVVVVVVDALDDCSTVVRMMT